MTENPRRLALAQGIAAGLLFGTAAVFIRLLGEINVFSIALWRLAIATAILAVAVSVLKRRFRFDAVRKNLQQFLVLGLLLGTHFLLFISAVKSTTILNATVLVNTTPIFSMVISTFLYRVKPSRMALLGMVVSFLGAGIIAFRDAERGQTANLIGDLEAMLAAVAEGFYLNYGRERRRRLPLLPTMLLIYIAAGLTVGGVALTAFIPFEAPHRLDLYLPLLGLGILPTATAHTLYFSSLSSLKSFETATMALLEPLGATVLGIAFFAEVPTPLTVIGGALVLLGILSVAAARE